MSMCINNMVDIKNVDKDSIKVSDGKTWTPEGWLLIQIRVLY